MGIEVKVNPDSGLFIGYDSSNRQANGGTDYNNLQYPPRSYQVVDSAGQSFYVPLDSGRNIGIRAIFRCISQLPVDREFTIRLQWDDPTSDVDLMLFTPTLSGTKDTINWSKLENSYGGSLDVDDTYGYGPEMITHPIINTDSLNNFADIIVHYYGPRDGRNTKTTIIFKINEGQIYQQSCYLDPLDYWSVGKINLKTGNFVPDSSCHINKNVKLRLKD